MLYQDFRYGHERVKIFVNTDPETGKRYVPLQNILDSFPNVNRVLLDGAPVPFMTDAFVQEYDPPRIPYYPGETLDLVTSSAASLGSPGSSVFGDTSPAATATAIAGAHQPPPPIPPRPPTQLGPPIPPRPSSQGSQQSEYLLLNYTGQSNQDLRQEEEQPFHPTQNHARGIRRHPSTSVNSILSGQLTFRFEESLSIRLTLFGIVVLLVVTLQLVGFSDKVIDGYTGSRDDLKQRIIYWATACSIVHSAMLYFLARWFTKDLVWHWDAKDLHHLWGLSPSVASILVVFRVRAPAIILIAIILTLIAIFAMVINLWLTSATAILPHHYQVPTTNITLMDIPWMDEDNINFGFQDGSIFDSFVQQGSIGYLGKWQLTPYQGKYFWAPILVVDQPTNVYVENVHGFSVDPVCRQMTNTEIRQPPSINIVYDESRTLPLGPFNATITGPRGYSQFWGFYADGEQAFDRDDQEYVTVYNLMTSSRPEFGPPTFVTVRGNYTRYAYAVTCNVTAEAWNITGYISSYTTQRLYNIQSVKRLDVSMPTYLWWTMRGMDRWTKTTMALKNDNEGRGLLTMMWMWMHGQRYVDQDIEPPLINVPIANWTAQKMTEIMAATLNTNTAAIQPHAVHGALLLETSIIEVNAAKLIGGLLFQLAYVSLAVGLYITKRTNKLYRSDDITHLLKKDFFPNISRPL
ncbi:hypothetical protein BGZ73_007297 [Actinomortierella ambigua]|nr:hypothetical protein BGZ73_007297 [Actinomortierella ambigua]